MRISIDRQKLLKECLSSQKQNGIFSFILLLLLSLYYYKIEHAEYE